VLVGRAFVGLLTGDGVGDALRIDEDECLFLNLAAGLFEGLTLLVDPHGVAEAIQALHGHEVCLSVVAHVCVGWRRRRIRYYWSRTPGKSQHNQGRDEVLHERSLQLGAPFGKKNYEVAHLPVAQLMEKVVSKFEFLPGNRSWGGTVEVLKVTGEEDRDEHIYIRMRVGKRTIWLPRATLSLVIDALVLANADAKARYSELIAKMNRED
jgi:hypothetical protein